MIGRRVANCVFCDDVRQEVGNKLSLMGVYSTEILFPMAPPIIYPKFAVVVWIISEVSDVPKKFSIRILVPPEGTEIGRIEAEGEPLFVTPPDKLAKYATIRMVIPMAN